MVKDRIWAKIGFYLLSMVFFILIVAILGTEIPKSFYTDEPFIASRDLLSIGFLVPMVCILMFLYVIFFIKWIKHQQKGTRVKKITIQKVENVNSETMSFVATYFFPLVSFNLNSTYKHAIILLGLFVLIGFIYIKADIYYCNPTLNVLGYNISKIEGLTPEGTAFNRVVISKDKLCINDKFEYIHIDNTTCFGFKK